MLFAIVVVGVLLRARLYLDGLPPDAMWAGEPLITSTDGYFFAAGVGNAVSDDWLGLTRVPHLKDHALVAIPAFLVTLGVPRELVFAWLPVLLGPLAALPLAFIGRAFGRSMLGLAAALGMVLAPAFVVRTALGYFDTDAFALIVPLTAAVFLVRLLREGATSPRRDALLAALTLGAYVWFYDQGTTLTYLMAVVAALALLSNGLLRVTPEAARHTLLIALALVPVYWLIRVGAVVVAHVAFTRVTLAPKVMAALAGVAMVVVLVMSPALRQLTNKLVTYTAPAAQVAAPEAAPGADATWKDHDTTRLVAEIQTLPFGDTAALVSGHAFLSLLGVLGFVLFVLWRPSLVVLVPIAAIGVFAFIGGHRFVMYLAPAVALGLAYLMARVTRALPRVVHLGAIAALALACAMPALGKINRDDLRVVFDAQDVATLVALDQVATTADTTIAWWDYGYPITYFAKTHVVTDGSRRGNDASLAAEVLLTSNPARAANLARLMADANDVNIGAAALLVDAAKAQGIGVDAFLAAVDAGQWPGRPRSGEVYLFLTKRLLPILPALVDVRPLAGGATRPRAVVRLYPGVRSEGDKLYLEEGVVVDAGTVKMTRPRGEGGTESKDLRAVHVVGGSGASLKRGVRQGNASAPTVGVLMRDLRLFVELDAELLTSQWAQLYFFEAADPRYYEPVHLSPTSKVYRFRGAP